MSKSIDLDECYNVAVKLAQEAGELIRNAIGKKKCIETKICNVDLVTETDKQVQDLLQKGFKDNFPDHCFIGEEDPTSRNLTDAPTWIIDPVDGTMNFVHSFPYTAVSIGFTIEKNVVLGIVYNPILDRMFTGVKDKGAFCNGKKIQVSATPDLAHSLILTEVGSTRTRDVMENVFKNFNNLVFKTHGIRMMGSAALNMCAVASGEADGYFEYTLHCWDMAGAKIIVEEAGGTVMDPAGGALDLMARRILCACNPHVAQTLSNELSHYQAERD